MEVRYILALFTYYDAFRIKRNGCLNKYYKMYIKQRANTSSVIVVVENHGSSLVYYHSQSTGPEPFINREISLC